MTSLKSETRFTRMVSLPSHAASVICLGLIGALVAISPGSTAEPQLLSLGTLQIPADCALAKNEHPRLLFTKSDLPAIRQRLEDPRLRDVFARLKKTVDAQLAQGQGRALAALVPLGLLYQITGEEKYGQACRAATLKASFGTYAALGAYGYDLAYDLLSPQERRRCEQKMLDYVKTPYRWRSRFIQCVGLWGSGLEDELVAGKLAGLYQWLTAHQVELDTWAADRGGDDNSHAYIGQHEYVGTMGALVAWKAATGEDRIEGFRWARTMAPYYIYHYLPGGSMTVNIGINSWGGRDCPRETGANNFTSIAQSKWQCGLTSWWVDNVVMKTRYDYDILGTHWGPILWFDPAVPERAPQLFPEDMLFKTRGYLCMRSDWGSDATFVHFHSGRFESDGRNQPDNNSFVIYRKAYLACDSGTRGANNPGHPLNDGWPGKHHDRYFIQSLAHNTITVGTESVKGIEGCTAVCGGQVSRVPKEWLKRYGLPVTNPGRFTRRAGTIVAYQTTPEYCYAAGDARRSYSPDRVRAFTRQLLYVRPGVVVLFDRVTSVKPEDPKRWYLHTMEQPQGLDSPLTPDRSVHPEGHYLATGTTLRTPHRGSALFLKTVLPQRKITRVLGGKGHQFEVNGENYDMSPKWWEKVGTTSYQETIGLGAWRVEIEPEEKQCEDLFLNVLWATDAAVTTMFPVETIRELGRVGVRFTADGTTVEVTFAQRGELGGHLRLTRLGGRITDTPLGTTVEDHYRHWKTDPRFARWQSDPYFRAVLRRNDVANGE